MRPTTPVFVVPTINNCKTSRPEVAGIPIIYHQTGILSNIDVHFQSKH